MSNRPTRRILYIVHHRRDRSPGQRFRFEQYLQHLQAKGFETEISILLNAEDDRIFYQGTPWQKFLLLLRASWRRWRDVRRARRFDVIFLFREAHMLGTTFFERGMARSGTPLVFDFDDSIWLQNVSEANKQFAFLKNAEKTADLIELCHGVLAGNAYLADYARQHNPNVVIMPTTIDTQEYLPRPTPKPEGGPVVLGWSGSVTTIQHFKTAVPVLKKIKQKYGDRVAFRVIGDGAYTEPDLDLQGMPWRKATELEDLQEIDIGLMPLPDDEWARGKCGLKGLQYMALGIPTLMSPVGVNSEIIQDGQNGFLCANEEEWLEKIGRLVESAELRRQMGQAGRRTVVDHYSVLAWQDTYVRLMEAVAKRRNLAEVLAD